MADNPTISKITLPSGTTYDLKDAKAREDIAGISQSIAGGVSFIGETTTQLTDGATTNPIVINGNNVTAIKGNLVVYGTEEFIFDGTKWILFGDLGTLKALAFKDSASTDYTPVGSVSQPSFTGSEATLSVSGTPLGGVSISTGTGTANYTPGGTITNTGISVTPSSTVVNSITSAGSLPSFSATVTSENLSLSFDSGALPSIGSSTSVLTSVTAAFTSTPSFSGSAVNLTATFTGSSTTFSGSYTPQGSVSQPSFTGTQATITVS